MNQEPENREGFDARMTTDPLADNNDNVSHAQAVPVEVGRVVPRFNLPLTKGAWLDVPASWRRSSASRRN